MKNEKQLREKIDALRKQKQQSFSSFRDGYLDGAITALQWVLKEVRLG